MLLSLTPVENAIANKATGWLWDKIKGRKKLLFHDARCSYSYSHYDGRGSHLREGGQIKIYEVHCQATIQNDDPVARSMRNLRIVANINGEIYNLNLHDSGQNAWKSSYNIPATHTDEFRWRAYTQGHGIVMHHPGMIPLMPGANQLSFCICYLDERSHEQQIDLPAPQALKMDPRFIVG
ncbi:hypothetical protein [Dinghuibacter silviterrae]|uniref:Uncharacterized protein n=1 Tax=Dinghuibacter silviterrae TaxID=1539049 RepID=A0A4R8DH81_9BACT|nr:hypothetical protein [Dinghuibacter silviterrae]TDW97063.1 hypothetical protein EDB95_4901 [Dinghuibacter silviterrae]